MTDEKEAVQKIVKSTVYEMSKARKKKGVEARYFEYIDLFNAELNGDVRRCIFTQELSYHCNIKDRWCSVFSSEALGKLRSAAHDSQGRYAPTKIIDHLYRRQAELEPELLLSFTPWEEGKDPDHIAEIAKCIKARNLTTEQITEILKGWGSTMFKRLERPDQYQNTILVLIGSQGVGKDTLIRSLVGGLKQYLVPLTIAAQERDLFQQVTSGLVMHISEFDRTNKAEVASLKHLITAERLNFRAAYEARANDYAVRSSFIASTNVDAVLRDETGNRRYVIIDIESIDWKYSTDKSDKILGQWQALAKSNYKISDQTRETIKLYISGATPDNQDDDIEDAFGYWLQAKIAENPMSKRGGLLSHECKEFWEECRIYQQGIKNIKSMLKRRGWLKRTKAGSLYQVNEEWAAKRSENQPVPQDEYDALISTI